jgi:hypothetical protein
MGTLGAKTSQWHPVHVPYLPYPRYATGSAFLCTKIIKMPTIKMYSSISLGLKITKIKIPGNIVERLWHINNVTSYEDFQFKM